MKAERPAGLRAHPLASQMDHRARSRDRRSATSVAEFQRHQRQYQASTEVLTGSPGATVDSTVIATEIGILQSNAVRAIVAKHIGDPGTIRRTK